MKQESADRLRQLCDLRFIIRAGLQLERLFTIQCKDAHDRLGIHGIAPDLKQCFKAELAHDVDEFSNISDLGKVNRCRKHINNLPFTGQYETAT